MRPDTPDAVVTRVVRALLERLARTTNHDLNVETIDGQPARGSKYLDAFKEAGFKRGTAGLRYYRSV